MKTTPKKKNNYVNNKMLFEEFKKYRAQPEDKRVISNYIGECIMQICQRLAFKPNFINYSYRDEMIDDAIENCVYAVPHFKPEASNNPFGYFTMVAWRAMIRRIQVEKKQNYIKHKNWQNKFLVDDIEGAGLQASSVTGGTSGNDLSNQVIDMFEKKLTEVKKKSKVGVLACTVDKPSKIPKQQKKSA